MRLQFRPRPTPSFEEMSELLRAQLGPLLDQAEADGPEGNELIQLIDVLAEDGQHLFDAHLFCGDDGQVFRAGTTEHVASFSQGELTGPDDQALSEALRRGYAEFLEVAHEPEAHSR